MGISIETSPIDSTFGWFFVFDFRGVWKSFETLVEVFSLIHDHRYLREKFLKEQLAEIKIYSEEIQKTRTIERVK